MWGKEVIAIAIHTTWTRQHENRDSTKASFLSKILMILDGLIFSLDHQA
jgi:heme A synthase